MQPAMWNPPVPLNPQEEQIVHKIRKAKLFVFLRKPRHELFDEAFRPGVSQQSPGIFPPLRCELFTLASSL